MTNFSSVNYPRAEDAVSDAMRYSLVHDEGVSLVAPWGRWYRAVQEEILKHAQSAPVDGDQGWYSGTMTPGRHWHIFLSGTE